MMGKFSCKRDEYLYELSMDGCDCETGEAMYDGWHGLLNGPLDWESSSFDDLPIDGQRELHQAAGAILHEDNNGFVSADIYQTKDALWAAWEAIEAEDETDL